MHWFSLRHDVCISDLFQLICVIGNASKPSIYHSGCGTCNNIHLVNSLGILEISYIHENWLKCLCCTGDFGLHVWDKTQGTTLRCCSQRCCRAQAKLRKYKWRKVMIAVEGIIKLEPGSLHSFCWSESFLSVLINYISPTSLSAKHLKLPF